MSDQGSILIAASAAERSADRHRAIAARFLCDDIARDRLPLVTDYEREHSLAARADSLEESALMREWLAEFEATS